MPANSPDRPSLLRRRQPHLVVAGLVAGFALGVAGVLINQAGSGGTATKAAAADTTFRPVATQVVGDLENPWDITWVGDVMLFNERAGKVWTKREGGEVHRVSLPMPKLWVQNRTGLLGMVADPQAATNRHFYTCMSVARPNGKPKDIEVWKWKLTGDSSAERVATLVDGIPLTTGKNMGCRLRFGQDGTLFVGTGDGGLSRAAQDPSSLGGKVLRLNADGSAPEDNPFYARGGDARYVWNYGHRNVQGLLVRPGSDQMWSVEQGTDRDDEINLVVRGANYGWDPSPGYREDAPMTDTARYPKALPAAWTSGASAVATCGATFIDGPQWGPWDGWLAVALLRGEGIRFYGVSGDDVVQQDTMFAGYGRTRTVQQGPDGALYFLTSNGLDDGIYRMTLQ